MSFLRVLICRFGLRCLLLFLCWQLYWPLGRLDLGVTRSPRDEQRRTARDEMIWRCERLGLRERLRALGRMDQPAQATDVKPARQPALLTANRRSSASLSATHRPLYNSPTIERPSQAHLLPKTLRDAALSKAAFASPARMFSFAAMSPAAETQAELETPQPEVKSNTGLIDLLVGRGGRAFLPQSQPESPKISPKTTDEIAPVPVKSTSWFSNLLSVKAPTPEEAEDEKSASKDTKEDRLLSEEDKSAPDEPEWARLKERYMTPKYPLVFCHGLFGFDKIGPDVLPSLQISYWRGLQEALDAAGCETLFTQVPMSAGIEERAKVLAATISEKLPGREVNLIGHSMGGLDARFLVSQLKPVNFKVRSICTVSTPHRGSPFADYMIDEVVGKNNMSWMLNALGFLQLPGGGKAFEDLTTTNMARFNIETPDDPNVAYFSYASRCNPSLWDAFRIPWSIIHDLEGDNDGLVSIASATYGTYCGTLENVNHADTCGWTGPVRYKYAEIVGKPIKYKAATFYLSIAERLAKAGY